MKALSTGVGQKFLKTLWPDYAEPDGVRLTFRRIVTRAVSSINAQDYPQFPGVDNIPAELIEHDSDALKDIGD